MMHRVSAYLHYWFVLFYFPIGLHYKNIQYLYTLLTFALYVNLCAFVTETNHDSAIIHSFENVFGLPPQALRSFDFLFAAGKENRLLFCFFVCVALQKHYQPIMAHRETKRQDLF